MVPTASIGQCVETAGAALLRVGGWGRSVAVRVVLGVALIAGTMVTAAAPSASAAPGWSVVPSPSPPGPPLADFSGVSCVSATMCFAVGRGASGTVVERWNGSAWSITPNPIPRGVRAVELNGVSCVSAKFCVAVGDDLSGTSKLVITTLVERWNGKAWSIMPSPTPRGASDVTLRDVSCSSATNCFAVGYSEKGRGFLGGTFTTLVEHWNGSRWSIVKSPNPKHTNTAGLFGVSCPTASSCFAVGQDFGSTLLAERWNGKRWSLMAVPYPGFGSLAKHHRSRGSVVSPRVAGRFGSRLGTGSGLGPRLLDSFSSSPGLEDVSCSSATRCFAVGAGFSGPLVERWDGKHWSTVPSPLPTGADGATLLGVSCASATDCSAVGSSSSFTSFDEIGSFATLAEHWDGTAWSVVATPTPGNAFLAQLRGVSCPSAGTCTAVGPSALIEKWNGTSWSTDPLDAQSSQSELDRVSCTSSTDCFAVGRYSSSTTDSPLIEHWDGSGWSVVPSPVPDGAVAAWLNDVSCTSPTDCFAVGAYETTSTEAALVEHWDGAAWSVVPSPYPEGALGALLNGVSCATPTNCMAVGIYGASSADNTLVEHWNGIAWSIVPSPNPLFAESNQLIDVSCPTATSCTAVGEYEAFTATRMLTIRPLVEHWNGTKWAMATTPNPRGAFEAGLFGVSCATATNCTAVGAQVSRSTGTTQALIEHWNGRTWIERPSPRTGGATGAQLNDVSCASATSCDAVGYSSAGNGRTLIEHSNGPTWSIVASPNPRGASGAGLSGVSCPAPSGCTAVGSYAARGGFFTLTERNP